MSTLWPRNKPLVQPPHFRTGSVPPPPTNPVERAALVALNHARNDREGCSMSWQAYEAAKRAWIDANPGATPEQYADAMRAIADRCGV